MGPTFVPSIQELLSFLPPGPALPWPLCPFPYPHSYTFQLCSEPCQACGQHKKTWAWLLQSCSHGSHFHLSYLPRHFPALLLDFLPSFSGLPSSTSSPNRPWSLGVSVKHSKIGVTSPFTSSVCQVATTFPFNSLCFCGIHMRYCVWQDLASYLAHGCTYSFVDGESGVARDQRTWPTWWFCDPGSQVPASLLCWVPDYWPIRTSSSTAIYFG